MKKIVLFWILLITLGVKAFADEKVTFTTSAPDAVVVGDQFKLSYTVTTQSREDTVVRNLCFLNSHLSLYIYRIYGEGAHYL